MKYYVLKQDFSMDGTIELTKEIPYKPNMLTEEFSKASNLVNYFKQNQFIKYSDVLFSPYILLSEPSKKVFSLYEEEMQFKIVQIFADEIADDTTFRYYFPNVKCLDCLSDKTIVLPNKEIKELILSKEKINNHHVFYVDGILSLNLIVSAAVVESFLRRGLYGVKFEEVLISN